MTEVARLAFRSGVLFVIKVEDTAFIGFKHFFSFSLSICLIRVELLLHQTVILFEFVGEDYFLFRRVVNTFVSLLHAELNGRLSQDAVRKRIVFFKLYLPIAAKQAHVRFPQRAGRVAQLDSICWPAHCRLSLIPLVLVVGLLEDGDGVFFPVGLHVARVERHVVVIICFFVALSLVRNHDCVALRELSLFSRRSLGSDGFLRRRLKLTRLPLHIAHVPMQALKVDRQIFDFDLEYVLVLSVGQSRLLEVREHEEVRHH